MRDSIKYKSIGGLGRVGEFKNLLPDLFSHSPIRKRTSSRNSRSSSSSLEETSEGSEQHGRISKIKVYTSKVIDQVKVVHDNGSFCCYGHRTKNSRSETALFTPGEYLVRVTHRPCRHGDGGVGVAMELETNKGLRFSYQPSPVAMIAPEDQSTIEALPGHEITNFEIREGKMTDYLEKFAPEQECC